MKKILIIHNQYRFLGGEDIAVQNEILFLKKHFDVEILYFDNEVVNIKSFIEQFLYFILNRNFKSKKILEKKLHEFNPDLVYVHNTWFKASLSIFDVLKEKNINTFIKIHNFRYSCTRHFLRKTHLKGKKFCTACGLKESNFPFNSYFGDSFIKSFLVIRYGKKYMKVLQNYPFQLLVLTNFHKNYLKQLDVNSDNIHVLNNYLNIQSNSKKAKSSDYIIYAGRISEEKGVEELITSYLQSNLRSVTLKIAGTGPEFKNLENKYSLYEEIEFLGQLDNKIVIELIKNALAVVSATKLLEGQPTILCEASLSGTPSIFPQSGGIQEFFPEDSLLSFKQYDYTDLINKLNLLNNFELLEEEGARNKIFIEKLLSEKIILNKFQGLLNG